MREKTTGFMEFDGKKHARPSPKQRQRRAPVKARHAGHRVGTSTLLYDPCSAAAWLDHASRQTGGFFPALRWASCSAPYPFELFYRLPAVTVGTPTADKICNRSIANLSGQTAKQHLLFQTRSPPAFTYLALF